MRDGILPFPKGEDREYPRSLNDLAGKYYRRERNDQQVKLQKQAEVVSMLVY